MTDLKAQGVSSHQSLSGLEVMVCVPRSHRFVSFVTEALLGQYILPELERHQIDRHSNQFQKLVPLVQQ